MPVTDLLERNHKLYSDEVALVELNPLVKDTRKTTWKEYDLVQQTSAVPYRRESTWSIFDEKANRVANMLLGRGIQKGDRVAILMFNCLEWLPIYFGILKTGAIAVPFNFRFSADEIKYCAIYRRRAWQGTFADLCRRRVSDVCRKLSGAGSGLFQPGAAGTFRG